MIEKLLSAPLAERHNLNGVDVLSFVYESPCLVIIVRTADFNKALPSPGSVFVLDNKRYAVQNVSCVGDFIKIALIY